MPADRLLVRGGGFYIWEAKDYIVGSFLSTQPPATTARAAAEKLLTRNLYFTHLHLGKWSRRARPLESDGCAAHGWCPRSASPCKLWRLNSPAVCKICGDCSPRFVVSLCVYESLPVDPDVHQELMEPGSRPIGCLGSGRAWFGPPTTGLRVRRKIAPRLGH